MASSKITPELRKQIEVTANHCCEYCHTSQLISGIPCQIDHILPTSAGGKTKLNNLCLACFNCNSHKWAKTEAIDPKTGRSTVLFHPREMIWEDHFVWAEPPYLLIGKTDIGRATIEALKINNDLSIAARKIWASVGLHP